ncbi:MAG TPA: tetratricopeptide repeat protein [Nitrospira sp.]|nr:tetratricopeptide repeat protein [Nitrospira sp.]
MILSSALLASLLALPSSPLVESRSFEPRIPVRELSGHELIQIGEIHDAQNHFPEALTYYEQALRSFRALKRRKDEATTLLKISSVLERQGQRATAAMKLRNAVSLFEKIRNHRDHPKALLALGRLSAWLGSPDAAEGYFREALRRFGQFHDSEGQGGAFIALGMLKVVYGPQRDGIALLQRALQEARQRGDDHQTLSALVALGDAAWLEEKAEEGRSYYVEALALARKTLDARLQADLERRLTSVYAALGHDHEAIATANDAVRLYHSLSDTSGEAATWALLAWLYERTDQQESAETATQRALLLQRHQQFTVHGGS